MINKNLLRSKLAAVGLTQKKLGTLVGMSENTISAKINGNGRLYVDEVEHICSALGIESPAEKAEIFLGSTSQNRDKITTS